MAIDRNTFEQFQRKINEIKQKALKIKQALDKIAANRARSNASSKSTTNSTRSNYSTSSSYTPIRRSASTRRTRSSSYSKPKYDPNSIVDFLKSQGKDSSFSARAKLAKQYGITNYRGTAEQNVRLLNLLKQGAKPSRTYTSISQTNIPQNSQVPSNINTLVNQPINGSGQTNKYVKINQVLMERTSTGYKPVTDVNKIKQNYNSAPEIGYKPNQKFEMPEGITTEQALNFQPNPKLFTKEQIDAFNKSKESYKLLERLSQAGYGNVDLSQLPPDTEISLENFRRLEALGKLPIKLENVDVPVLQAGDFAKVKEFLKLNPPKIQIPDKIDVPQFDLSKVKELLGDLKPVKIPEAIDVNQLQQEPQQITLPQPQVQEPTFEPVDVQALIDQYKQMFTPSEEEQKLQQQEDIIAQLTGQLASKEQRRAQLEQQFGIDQKQKTIQSLLNQLQALNTSAQTGQLLAEERLAPMQAITGEKMAIERQRAVKALTLKSMIDAAQGDLATALDSVERALKAEFEPVEAKLAQAKLRLQSLRDQLDRLDRRKAKAVELALREREKILNKQEKELEKWKQTRKDIALLALNAARNGADPLVLQQIQNAKSVEEAIGYGGTYVLDPEKIQELKMQKIKEAALLQDMAMQRAQMELKAQATLQDFKTTLLRLGLDEYRANLASRELEQNIINDIVKNQILVRSNYIDEKTAEANINKALASTQAILEGIGLDKYKAQLAAKELEANLKRTLAQAKYYEASAQKQRLVSTGSTVVGGSGTSAIAEALKELDNLEKQKQQEGFFTKTWNYIKSWF